MKQCTKCKEVKPLDLFATKSKSKDGKTNWCKACFAEHARAKYQNGDRERKERNKAKTISSNRERIKEYLESHPCVDCGESDIRVLQFDHKDPVTKKGNVCELLPWSWRVIKEEIDKCDVRCANDHRRRTGEQFGYWK